MAEQDGPSTHTDQRNMSPLEEAEHFITECARVAALPCTAESAAEFRRLQGDEVRIRKRVEKTHEEEKAPHLAECRKVDGKYLPFVPKLKDAVRSITQKLTAWMEAEERRQREEAAAARRAAEEEAARAARLAEEAVAVQEDDPFAAFDHVKEAQQVEANANALHRAAAAPVKVKVVGTDGGRAAGLRTVGYIVEVTDAAALVAHYADRADVIEAARKCAAAEAKATKGEKTIPGVAIKADRRAA